MSLGFRANQISLDLSASGPSEPIDLSGALSVDLIFNAVTGDHDGTIKVQKSSDGSVWRDVTLFNKSTGAVEASVTVAPASTLETDREVTIAARFMRLYYTRSAGGAAQTCTVSVHSKSGGALAGIASLLLAAISAVLGATTGAAVVSDAVGTVQQYLRGLVALVGGTSFPDCSVAIADSAALVATTNVQSAQLPVGRYLLWATVDIHFKQGATGAAAADATARQIAAGDQRGFRVDNTTTKGFLQIYPLGAGRYWIEGPL